MNSAYKFFWVTHKWIGILFSVVFLNLSVTGYLLLVKKNHAWIQPPTQMGKEGGLEDFISTRQLLEIVLQQNHEDFSKLEDIDRVDFRPAKRTFKVRSHHNHSEIQVDAVTGKVLSVDWRPSDLIESLHDGSFYGSWCHATLMPITAATLLFLTVSGLYLWLVRRRAEKMRQATTLK